jgi:membrane protease YdiL (CAAX protease family)
MLTGKNALSQPVLEALVASTGMILFATLVRCPLLPSWISAVGLLATALAISCSLHSAPHLAEIFALYPPSRRMAVYLVIGGAGGAALGIFSRLSHDAGALPSGIGQFVFWAASIGASEELLFRGYIQGRLHPLGSVPAVVLAAAAHSAYQLSLFVFLPEGIAVDYLSLGFCTFVVGLAGGALREWSGSVIPPLAGHVLFDIVVYGGRSMAPWWVWS